MYIKDGKKINLVNGMIIDDVQLVLPISADTLAAMGISEVADPVRPDDRFYYVSENDDGSFKAVPKDLAALQAMLIAQGKTVCNALLAQTDWQVTRLAERKIPIDANVAAYRADVLAAEVAGETAVDGAKDVPSLEAVVYVWPKVSE